MFKSLSLSFASSLGAKVSATGALGHQVSYVCSQKHSRSLLWDWGFRRSEIFQQTETLLQKYYSPRVLEPCQRHPGMLKLS